MAALRLNRSTWAALALLNLLLLALIALLLQFRGERAELARLDQLGAAVYPAPAPLSGIALADQHGAPFGLADMIGHWNLVFFGFTNCPDMCPMTLAQLEDFYRAKHEQKPATRAQVVFVSVDPADTPETIKNYLAGFHGDFIGLSGNVEAVAGFAAQLFANTGAGGMAGLDHGHAADAPENVISHSIHIGVVSPAGELVGLLRPPHRAAAIAEALEMIAGRG